MKDVASVLFSNLQAVQARVDAIQRRLGKLQPPPAPAEAPRTDSAGKREAASIQPYFPKDLECALRPVIDSNDTSSISVGEYDDIIESSAAKNGVDPDLVKAIVRAESAFRKNVVSPAGAMGLMQLMPATASSLGVSDPYDPVQNIEAGTRYLKSQIDRFGSTELALAAYNAGPARVVQYGGVPPFSETRDYVSRVMGYLGEIKGFTP